MDCYVRRDYDRKDARCFKRFRQSLYNGDHCYVSTSEFVLDSLIFKETKFARECIIEIAVVISGSETKAQALFIFHPSLPYLQVAFFDALAECHDEVCALINAARNEAQHLGASRVVVGLNGHISYGVGILTDGFDYLNSFDSLYNKPYYAQYFDKLESQALSTYRAKLSELRRVLDVKRSASSTEITVRHARMSRFRDEAETMRRLCEQTISRTNLYFETHEGHFFELMKDMLPFLRDENLLFALDSQGNEIGFLFWHPDFNRMLRSGRLCSLPEIALSYVFRRGRIDTAKLNAVGSNSYRATLALIEELCRVLGNRYEYLETNFVWDNNLPSRRLNEHFFGKAHRKYGVFYIDVNKDN